MGVSDAAGRNIADGSSFTWTQLWMTVTTYSTTAKLPYQASFGVMGVADRSEYRTCGTFTTTDPYPDIASKPLSYLGSYRRNLNWSHRTDGSLSRNLDA